MPRIFDNIELTLAPALQDVLQISQRADFAVGYFNLRGWKHLDWCIEDWQQPGQTCRLIIGMQKSPQEELRAYLGLHRNGDDSVPMDNQTATRLKRSLAEDLREQLTFGLPNNSDEAGLSCWRIADRCAGLPAHGAGHRCAGLGG